MTRPALGALPAKADREVRHWMAATMAAPDPRLGRRGAVCPFLPAALGRDLVICRGRPWDAREPDPAGAVEQLVRDAVDVFTAAVWPEGHAHLRAVVAVAVGMPRDRWPLIESVHAALKSEVVQQGLMIGEFHGDHPGGAIHNPHFKVLRSPHPLVVVRAMAPHDVLFLHHRRDLFAAYASRYAHLYGPGGRPPGQMQADLFHAAAARWGSVSQPAGRP